MASGRANNQLSQLWQVPLLLVSLVLFAVAAWLLISPHRLTIDERLQIARAYLNQGRPESANEYLNRLLSTEKLDAPHQGAVHLMLAQTLEVWQRQQRQSVPVLHQRIIEQTRLALGQGIKADAELYRRMGDSYQALDRVQEALAAYRQAMTLDTGHALRLQRTMIELQIAHGDTESAELALEQYLKNPDLTNAERAWATGQQAQILMDRGRLLEARAMLAEALNLATDPVAQGQLNYYLGYSLWKMANNAEAERHLRVARDQLGEQHPLDGDACYVLGRIAQERRQPQQAASFYQIVLVSHIDSRIAPLALLGRGICRIMQDDDEAGLSDLHDLTNQINQKASRVKYRPEALTAFQQAENLLIAKGNYQGALEVLACEQSLEPDPPAAFFARLGSVYEKRADQIAKTVADAKPADQARRTQQAREMRALAGDAHIAYSRALTLVDDKGYGEALWRGIDLYDRAGDLQRAIGALEVFTAERPDDPLAPEALRRLGLAYQAAGLFDKAIAAFQQNQLRHPQTLAASKSAVPLAQAYIAKGPDAYAKAESVLLSVVENNPLLSPEAEEFRQALFELGSLYYHTGRYEEAVARLEEWTQRYPRNQRMGQLLFLMADSYRKSAALLDGTVTPSALLAPTVAAGPASTRPTTMMADAVEIETARKARLTKARSLYDQVIEVYRAAAPARAVDREYLKLAHFYRADCLYDLGSYEEAIRLYDAAAFRYQEDPSALAAYVQIVNAYCALGKMSEAKTANERAKWLLRRMPPDAFENGGFTMPRAYWEQWLRWTSDAGMF